MICPCQKIQDNAKTYELCCKPYHQGKSATAPETLMRSRFSAYALGLSDYLSKTWHQSTRPADLNLEADDQWVKLDIVSSNKKQVHFRAYLKNENFNSQSQDHYSVLEEVSDFVFEGGKWLYVSGDTKTEKYKQQRNEICLCGSTKKYKKCCALK